MTLTLAPPQGRLAAATMPGMASCDADTETTPILRRVAEGAPGAVDDCLERFGGLVWSLARRLATTESDAEDAVQDIFLDIWKSAHRYDPGVASEVTFVAMIARRRLIDRRRKEGRAPNTQALTEASASQAAGSNTVDLPDVDPGAGEDVAAARRALGQLSQEQQRVLQLSIFHGLSHDKISKATGLPLGTVKTHARRGLIRIREIIESEASAGGKSRAEGGAGSEPISDLNRGVRTS